MLPKSNRQGVTIVGRKSSCYSAGATPVLCNITFLFASDGLVWAIAKAVRSMGSEVEGLL